MTMSMKMRSGFIAFAFRMPSSPFSAAAVLKPCFSRAFCMTNTSVGESSTIRISAIFNSPSFADVRFDGPQELVFGERLGKIVLGADDPAPGAVEQPVLAREHDHRDLPKHLVVLDEGAGLVPIETRHHDIHKNDVRLMVGDFRECVESIHGS